MLAGSRKHRHLAMSRRLIYFGFELETVVEEPGARCPSRSWSRHATPSPRLWCRRHPHSDQGRVRRALTELGELLPRTGGTLEQVVTTALRMRIRSALAR